MLLPNLALAVALVLPQEAPPVLAPHAPIVFGDDARNVYPEPFFPGATYDPEVARPDDLLRQPAGSRIASHDEVIQVLLALARTSDRVVVRQYGTSYEGRPLVVALITSPANHARIRGIAAAARERHAGGGTPPAGTPVVAWMGYGIHGDETSATEAALPFAYHLAASTDEDVARVLDRVVVVLDPCLNPDGRERIRSMVVQGAGFRANLDDGAMQRGRWPGGRGNHYLFDMNRDWMAGEAPETRARWRILAEFPPLLFVDAHEMSGLDTFLFYPQASPRNRHLPEDLDRWQQRLAADAALDFDRYGWGYYTREWADALYPGYSDAWGSLNGAIGMLYEQGKTIGAPLRRESGEIVSYRESVHGQVVASWANLRTFERYADEIGAAYDAHRARGRTDLEGLDGDAFVVRPSADVERDARFVRTLVEQGVVVEEVTAGFAAPDAVGLLGETVPEYAVEPGAWLVRASQPSGALVRAYLEFDPRLDAEFLKEERQAIERGKGSKVYDVTAWNLARQMGVDGAWVTLPAAVEARPIDAVRAPRGPVGDVAGAYAWIAEGEDTRSIRFVAQALEAGLQVHVSDEPFRATVRGDDGAPVAREFGRGSFLVRRHENTVEDLDAEVARLGGASGARVFAAVSGRAADGVGIDLGGQHFELLAEPRVAIISNSPVSPTSFGHLWRAVDEELGLPATHVDAQGWLDVDLDRYNVLIAPEGAGDLLVEREDSLSTWVRAGGTLVTVGSSAFAIAREDSALGCNRLRRDVLEELDAYAWRTAKERASSEVQVDPEAIYGARKISPSEAPKAEDGEDVDDASEKKDPDAGATPEALDAWRRSFSPAGVILRGELDPAAWITGGYGARTEVPVPFSGSRVLLSSVRPAVRLADEAEVRLGGLLWPEARTRVADSAWLTVEAVGRGHVVSFADSPVFRGSWRGTARLLLNAVVLGPGHAR